MREISVLYVYVWVLRKYWNKPQVAKDPGFNWMADRVGIPNSSIYPKPLTKVRGFVARPGNKLAWLSGWALKKTNDPEYRDCLKGFG